MSCGVGNVSRNARAALNWSVRARCVRSPETTTRWGCSEVTQRRSGARSASSTRPKCRSDNWTMVRMAFSVRHFCMGLLLPAGERARRRGDWLARICHIACRHRVAFGGDDDVQRGRADAVVQRCFHDGDLPIRCDMQALLTGLHGELCGAEGVEVLCFAQVPEQGAQRKAEQAQ